MLGVSWLFPEIPDNPFAEKPGSTQRLPQDGGAPGGAEVGGGPGHLDAELLGGAQGPAGIAQEFPGEEDEIRLTMEERASFSPDSLTGMEANLRFAGPETMETKIFGRLTAWQNWIFQRPNAVGENGALKLYGTGKRAAYNQERV